MPDFRGRYGLVIGVANRRSIAWAIAQEVAAGGARVALTYQDERLRGNVEELAATLDRALVLPCDVASDAQIAHLAAAVDREFGRLDFVVHSAAFAPRAELTEPFVRTTREGFRIALDVSAYSLIAVTRAVEPLLARRGGSVLTLTYLGSTRVFPGYNVMGVAKAALEGAVRYLAAELGPKQVRVNAVSAGPIRTLAAAAISGFSDILQIYRDRAPMRRNIDAAEVAQAAAFLLSDEASGITGEVVHVDAGYHITGI